MFISYLENDSSEKLKTKPKILPKNRRSKTQTLRRRPIRQRLIQQQSLQKRPIKQPIQAQIQSTRQQTPPSKILELETATLRQAQAQIQTIQEQPSYATNVSPSPQMNWIWILGGIGFIFTLFYFLNKKPTS